MTERPYQTDGKTLELVIFNYDARGTLAAGLIHAEVLRVSASKAGSVVVLPGHLTGRRNADVVPPAGDEGLDGITSYFYCLASFHMAQTAAASVAYGKAWPRRKDPTLHHLVRARVLSGHRCCCRAVSFILRLAPAGMLADRLSSASTDGFTGRAETVFSAIQSG